MHKWFTKWTLDRPHSVEPWCLHPYFLGSGIQYIFSVYWTTIICWNIQNTNVMRNKLCLPIILILVCNARFSMNVILIKMIFSYIQHVNWTHEYIKYHNFQKINIWAVVVLFTSTKSMCGWDKTKITLTGKYVFCMYNCSIIIKIRYSSIIGLSVQNMLCDNVWYLVFPSNGLWSI